MSLFMISCQVTQASIYSSEVSQILFLRKNKCICPYWFCQICQEVNCFKRFTYYCGKC